jgi:terminal uridylyltransferase
VLALAELCREREDDLHRAPRSSSPAAPPRAMSASRGNIITPPANGTGSAWRSQSQMPFDRVGPSQFDAPIRGRGSDSGADISAQELWLASQGSNLGGVGSLGLGFPETPYSAGGRGRDTASRGLETPGGPYRSSGGGGGGRRAPSAYDADNGGSGSVSAPLSPHRLYAQLEMGKGPAGTPSGWPSFDPRQLPSGAPMPVGGGTGAAPGYRSVSRSNVAATTKTAEPSVQLPSFQPFSPPLLNSTLRHIHGEPSATAFISPSTLLSPPSQAAGLPPAGGMDRLARAFDQLGVEGPGFGAENDGKERIGAGSGSGGGLKAKSNGEPQGGKPAIRQNSQ